MINITDIRIKKFSGAHRLKAIVAITIDDCFVINELRIVEGKEGLFVAMPSRKLPNGEYRDAAHAINAETRAHVSTLILDAYKEEE